MLSKLLIVVKIAFIFNLNFIIINITKLYVTHYNIQFLVWESGQKVLTDSPRHQVQKHHYQQYRSKCDIETIHNNIPSRLTQYRSALMGHGFHINEPNRLARPGWPMLPKVQQTLHRGSYGLLSGFTASQPPNHTYTDYMPPSPMGRSARGLTLPKLFAHSSTPSIKVDSASHASLWDLPWGRYGMVMVASSHNIDKILQDYADCIIPPKDGK